MRSARIGGLLCAAAIGQLLIAQTPDAAKHRAMSQAPIEATIPFAPTPVLGTDGRRHMAYEIHLTNFATVPITIHRLDFAVAGTPETPLGSAESEALDAMISHPGLAEEPKERRRIDGGARVILFLWPSWRTDDPNPPALLHKLYVSAPDSDTGAIVNMTMDLPLVTVSKEGPLVLGPPLRGSGWFAGNGPSGGSTHRRAAFPFYGTTTIAERYAYDFIQLGKDGMAFTGDRADNSNWKGFGAEVLAVADGVVADLQDGIPNNVPFSTERPVVITAQTSGGNYVTLDIGGGHFALFGHMQPHSLRVKLGDRVRRGQVLGLLGNAGNSTNAHLHFHVSTAMRPGEGEGVPVVFDSFHLLGQADIAAALALEKRPVTWLDTADSAANLRHKQMPLENDVVSFSAR